MTTPKGLILRITNTIHAKFPQYVNVRTEAELSRVPPMHSWLCGFCSAFLLPMPNQSGTPSKWNVLQCRTLADVDGITELFGGMLRFGGRAFDDILTLKLDAEDKDIIIDYYAQYVHTNAITGPVPSFCYACIDILMYRWQWFRGACINTLMHRLQWFHYACINMLKNEWKWFC